LISLAHPFALAAAAVGAEAAAAVAPGMPPLLRLPSRRHTFASAEAAEAAEAAVVAEPDG
jgi:hypothetical protein